MRGMIVAPQPEAVEAGALALKRGGNAIDAAIACAFMQGVVDPQMAGIAGFGLMQIYMPKRGIHLHLDFHTRCPASVTPDMWAHLIEGEARDGFGFLLKGKVNDVGYQSIAVPGSLRAYEEALAEFGTMTWTDVIGPAIERAREGFMVRPHVYTMWTQKESAFGRVDLVDKLRSTAAGQKIYFHPDGTLKSPGERIVNPDMARSLERIARDGADLFYRGEMAEEIAADMSRHGGRVSLDDLKAYKTTRSAPIWGSYRGCRIAGAPPPAGGTLVIEILHILENFDLKRLGHNSPEFIRVLAEAMKYATADKDQHVGDPAFVEVPLDRLLAKSYARELAARIESGEKAHVERLGQEKHGTTHISVVDGDGNVVSMTHSLGTPSGVITEGLGFMYNGCMSVYDPRPGRTGSLAPGKARFTSMSPTIVFKDDRPFIAIGAPGGTYISGSVAQGIVNVIDFEMSMLEAVTAPRISATSDIIDVSNRIPRFVTSEVEAMGYRIARSYQSYAFAGVHGIKMEGARWSGGADPQRDGMALEV
ncbi:MAG TPA: gamma-glutamyltransferase [Stellaceae bacterium]|jgi:gamma-glutamyltranspeptidase/glutathione hydrolase|nr:gamma-glutamyltransferase [Stellaceae bacterium]